MKCHRIKHIAAAFTACVLMYTEACALPCIEPVKEQDTVVGYVWLEDGTEVNGPEGWSGIAFKTDNGKVLSGAWRDADGNPVELGSGGYARVEMTYERNKLRKKCYFNLSGVPVAGPEGWAWCEYQFKNNSRQPTKVSAFSADGTPFVNERGYFSVVYEYGRNDRITSEEFYGPDGKRCLCTEGYAKATYGFTSVGDPTLTTYYDINNRPVAVPALGCASVLREYRGRHLISWTYRGTDKKPVNGPEGWATLTNTLNKTRNAVDSSTYTDRNGNPAAGPEGWHKAVYHTDKKGNVESSEYYDVNGQPFTPAAVSTAAARTEQTEDESGYLRYVTAYAADGSVLYPVTVYVLSGDGKILRESRVDANGTDITDRKNVCAVLYLYDSTNRITGIRYQDAHGQPVVSADGYAGFDDILDQYGFVLERHYLDADGSPAVLPDGSSGIRYLYGAGMNKTGEQLLDAEGNELVQQ